MKKLRKGKGREVVLKQFVVGVNKKKCQNESEFVDIFHYCNFFTIQIQWNKEEEFYFDKFGKIGQMRVMIYQIE